MCHHYDMRVIHKYQSGDNAPVELIQPVKDQFEAVFTVASFMRTAEGLENTPLPIRTISITVEW